MFDLEKIMSTARTVGSVAKTLGDAAASGIFDKVKDGADAVKRRALCLKNGHQWKYADTNEYMGEMGKEPVYWRLCQQCPAASPGKIPDEPGDRKRWVAVYSRESNDVHVRDLPNYATRIAAVANRKS